MGWGWVAAAGRGAPARPRPRGGGAAATTQSHHLRDDPPPPPPALRPAPEKQPAALQPTPLPLTGPPRAAPVATKVAHKEENARGVRRVVSKHNGDPAPETVKPRGGGGRSEEPSGPGLWPGRPFRPQTSLRDHQPSPKPASAPKRPDEAEKESVPCRKPRWSREPPPSAPPCWNRKGRWEEILETFQPEGRRGEGRGKLGGDWDPPPCTPGVSTRGAHSPHGLRPLLISLGVGSALPRRRFFCLTTQSPHLC